MTTRKYQVSVVKKTETYGYFEVEAEDEFQAIQIVMDTESWVIEEGADWGSCGDYTEIEVLHEDEVYDVTPPSVSDGLWV